MRGASRGPTIQRYRIKSSPDRDEFLEVTRRSESGCHVRIVRCYEGYETVTESFLESHMLEMCLQTGYLTEDFPIRDDKPGVPAGASSVAC